MNSDLSFMLHVVKGKKVIYLPLMESAWYVVVPPTKVLAESSMAWLICSDPKIPLGYFHDSCSLTEFKEYCDHASYYVSDEEILHIAVNFNFAYYARQNDEQWKMLRGTISDRLQWPEYLTEKEIFLIKLFNDSTYFEKKT